MAEPWIDEAELLDAVDALKRVGPEVQEAAILALEEQHPGIGGRARALLAIEERAAEAIRRAEEQGKKWTAEAKARAEAEAKKVVEPKPVPKPNLGQRPIRLEQLFPKKKIVAAPKEAEAKEDGVSFRDEKPASDDRPPILSKVAPYDTAKEFTRRYCFKEGVLAVYWYRGEFWEWNGRCYIRMNADAINKRVWDFLDEAKSGHPNDTNRFLPKPNDVENVIKALKAGLTIELNPPCWIDGTPAASLLVFRNGVVDIGTGELMALTPRLWIHHELDFDYDPEAKCPFWERWLDEVFEGDVESQECIEEQLGYGMTNDVRFQKAFLWIGQKGREGKGTLAHVLEQLCSPAAYVPLSFHDWLKGEYSKEAWMGKKVGCFPDVRFKEGKWYGQNYDPGGIDHASKEEALRISAGDPITIRRKWKSEEWRGVLPMKLFLLSNKLPVLNDSILASRFIHIAFNVSFRGREDVTIPDKLKTELPGVANRCLRAYRRLCQRGRFTQPRSGLELAKEVSRGTYPFGAFMEDQCMIDPAGSVRPVFLLLRLHKWCEENGETDLMKRTPTPVQLSKALKEWIQRENIQDLDTKTFRPHGEDRVWLGIRLKAAEAPKLVEAPKAKVVELRPWRRF